MYQALYRKWRPRTFDDVVGQESVVETLKRQIVLGRPSHAYLFTGTRGTGKTTCAKIFARAINCENPVNGNPCNKCPTCLGIESGSILDVEEMDAASNNGVGDMRALRDEAIYSPASAKRRVYIIDEVHMLSKDAFNALLKIMEEPPEHLCFILATTELHKVPATVLSRCQRFSFRRLPPAIISERLLKIAGAENLNLSDDAAELLSRLADGSMRDGISLLDQCASTDNISLQHVLEAIGLAGRTETESLLRATMDGDTAKALSILDRLYGEGKDVASILEELSTLQRDILISKIAPKSGWNLQSGGYDASVLKELSAKFSASRLMTSLETVQTALSDINRGGSRKIMAELCLMRLCGADSDGGIYLPEETKPSAKPPVAKSEPDDLPPWDVKPGEVKSEPTEAKTASVVKIQPSLNIEPKLQPLSNEESEAVSAESGGSWEAILKILRAQMSPLDYMYLGDTAHSDGEIDGNTLTIRAKSPFSKGMIDKKEITEAVRAAAEKALGHPVRVIVTDAQKPVGAVADKLDALSQFENIKFK